MGEAQLLVEGFLFEDEEQAQMAQKEAEAIRYLRSKTDTKDPDTVLSLYHKLLEQDMFHTPVGYAFLGELQEYLKTIPYIRQQEIAPILVRQEDGQAGNGNGRNRSKEQLEKGKRRDGAGKQEENAKTGVSQSNRKKAGRNSDEKTLSDVSGKRPASGVSLFFNVVLLLIVLVMFGITFTSNNVNILNYETQLQDKYAAWEAELTEREAAVAEKEAELE